jgi:hypothetical protein
VYELLSILIGALITAALLAVAHFIFWRVRLSLVVRYIIGVSGIGIGLTVALLLVHLPLAAIAFWAVAGAAGITISSLHLWRERRGDLPRDIEDAYANGQLAQFARGNRRGASRKP